MQQIVDFTNDLLSKQNFSLMKDEMLRRRFAHLHLKLDLFIFHMLLLIMYWVLSKEKSLRKFCTNKFKQVSFASEAKLIFWKEHAFLGDGYAR